MKKIEKEKDLTVLNVISMIEKKKKRKNVRAVKKKRTKRKRRKRKKSIDTEMKDIYDQLCLKSFITILFFCSTIVHFYIYKN